MRSLPTLDELLQKEIATKTLVTLNEESFLKTIMESKNYINALSELHSSVENTLEEFALSLFELRLSKFLENATMESFDNIFFNIIRNVESFYIKLISGNMITVQGKVLSKVVSNIMIGKIVLNKDELVVLPIGDAVRLTIAGYIKPCTLNDNDSNESSKEC
ncbi:hypothetical protein HS7_19870 [Sulfolobales archaeon HS-7]|nr:hypothetical protein HS7_19870 [Sulfolobales archaeon HS-7]